MLRCLQENPPRAPPDEGPGSPHLGAASKEGLDLESGIPSAPDLEASPENVNAGHATPGFSVSYWPRSSQEADKPPFALWAAWAKGLSRLGGWLSRRAADRTLVEKHCFLALPVLTLESVLSPAVLAEGLTPGFPACSFPSCRPGTVDTLRTGKWHRELRQVGGGSRPVVSEHTAPLRHSHSADVRGPLVCAWYPPGPG